MGNSAIRPRHVGHSLLASVAIVLTSTATCLTGTSVARAQPVTHGPEFESNTYTTGNQRQPAVAMADNGSLVAVWVSRGSAEDDHDDDSIQARLYDAEANPRGGQFQVNTLTANRQHEAAVATDAAGSFVVAWTSLDEVTDDLGIQGQRFDSNGSPLGTQFQVDAYTTNSQSAPSVGMDDSGRFVVVWRSYGSGDTDHDNNSVQGQRFDSNGDRLGAQFQVNTYTTGRQTLPAIAVDASGSFVVAWTSYGSSGNDQDENSIQWQRFDSNGSRLGPQDFQANSITTSYQRSAAVAISPESFVIVWAGYYSSGGDQESGRIQGQLFDSGGSPRGGEFQINTYSSGYQNYPAAAMDDSGAFVVTWDSDGSSASDQDGDSIQAQRFDPEGNPRGSEFQVNGYTTDGQYEVAVAATGGGDFVVLWQSLGSTTDLDQGSIQGQLYDGLFRDGFESGDTSRWSLSQP